MVQRKSRKGIKPAKSGHHLRLSVAHCTAALKSGFIYKYSVTLTAVSPPPLATPRTHPPRAAHFTSRPPVCPSAVSHSYLTRVPTRSAVLASPTARESSSLTDHRRLARLIGGDFLQKISKRSQRPSCPHRPRCPTCCPTCTPRSACRGPPPTPRSAAPTATSSPRCVRTTRRPPDRPSPRRSNRATPKRSPRRPTYTDRPTDPHRERPTGTSR